MVGRSFSCHGECNHDKIGTLFDGTNFYSLTVATGDVVKAMADDILQVQR